jgi:hypothetical protein
LALKFPPRDGRDRDKQMGVNEDEFIAALLRECLVEPELDEQDWAVLEDTLTYAQYNELGTTAWFINQEAVNVPFLPPALLNPGTPGAGSSRTSGGDFRAPVQRLDPDPTTRYRHDRRTGRVVEAVTTVESEWDDEQRGLMLALAEYEALTHGRAAGTCRRRPTRPTRAPTGRSRHRCHKCTAIAQAAVPYRENPQPQALMYPIDFVKG